MKFERKINPPVFFGSALLIVLLVGITALFPKATNALFTTLQSSIIANYSWFYIAAVAVILLLVIYLGLSRYGDIKLGPDHAEPDFRYGSWFAMLFSAGMGIGLMFFGVAEPVKHFLTPPLGESGTVEAARDAMNITFFHWGLHAWALYAIVALILAYFGYRQKLPLTLRSALYPVIGEKIHGPIGHAVDIFAILGTVFGVATSLGFGVLQVNAGLNYLFDIPVNTTVQVFAIIFITGLALISVTTGLEKGVKMLSELNLTLAALLLAMVLLLGPTALLFEMYVQNIGIYLADLVQKTFNLYAYQPTDWIGGWTLFYWGWWISWSPFVGMFIARISRGRTIREFVSGVLFVPTGFTFLWMTVFGNTSIDMILNQGISSLGEVVSQDVSLALFAFLEHFPFSAVLSFVAMLMVMVFFVTSADSGSLVIDMLAAGGDDDTPIWQRVFWGSLVGAVAVVLLLAGGLNALQTMTIASALPFSLVLLMASWGLFKALSLDHTKRESLTIGPQTEVPWDRRIRALVQFPRRQHVNRFVEHVVMPAMESVQEELGKHGVESEIQISEESGSVSFAAYHGEEMDFLYKVRARSYLKPNFTMEAEDDEASKYFRAEVFLLEGGQDYDLMGLTSEQVIRDIVDQYERHMHFLHQVRPE